ncbi:MAG: DNA primase [Bifidobacteriaceae bacterium]|jgi:hypothetical protein|nr:DNA primase [Bifidobacteriaceae bacterium]
MDSNPRAALDRLVAALERHFEATASGRGEEDPAFEAAYGQLVDAFEAYDEALYTEYGIDTPFLVYDDLEDDEEPYLAPDDLWDEDAEVEE